ncbi:peptidase domain-containing ABC transporter [Pseudoduganella sp. HUAS MS19]
MQVPFLTNIQFWRSRHLPVVLQTESAECGLACLSMVCSYWGHKTDIASMRRRFSVSLKGVTLKSLMAMATGVGLTPRPLKLGLEHVHELKLPCILHWDMNHFVVLKSLTRSHVVIHDPAVGERRVPLEEFSKHFTGVALELTPGSEFKKGEELQQFSLVSLMGRVIGLKRGLAQILLLGLALQVCALVAPFYMQWLVDEALLAADRDLITVLGVGFLLLVLLQTSIGGVRSWITTVIATNLNIQWLGNTFSHLMKLPLPYFEKRHTGDIVSRFGSIQTIQRSLTTQFVEGMIDGVLVLTTFIMMLLYSAKLAGVTCIATLLYVLMRWVIFRALREATAEQIIHASKQSTHFMESVRGIQSIRLFGRNDERRAGWLNALADQFNADLRIAKLSVSYQTANTFLFSAERVIVVWLAALLVLAGEFSVGMLFAFISYKDQFSQRIASLVDKLFEFRMLRLHGERVADIILAETEVVRNDTEIDVTQIMPSIEFRDISFRYSDSEPLVLANLNLTIPAGECIAITGPSGCGKTTLMKLMLGLLEPTEGHILVGGVKLNSLGLANYREMLGTVMQDDSLFAGSIQDNIAFFDPNPNQERIQHCAQLAAIHPEIAAMPMAYHTLIGDIGSGLSGGQKQRILLARALYKNPRILVLDEATSHLDVWNEGVVNKAIKQLALTRVMVAHRPETISMADRVVILQQGKIVQDVKASERQAPAKMA